MFSFTVRNPHGYVTRGDEKGHPVEADTIQCCHGGEHFEMIEGSGTRRGFCMKCMAITCGSLACDPCVPFEKRLEAGAR